MTKIDDKQRQKSFDTSCLLVRQGGTPGKKMATLSTCPPRHRNGQEVDIIMKELEKEV
jgi:hypothetical protein